MRCVGEGFPGEAQGGEREGERSIVQEKYSFGINGEAIRAEVRAKGTGSGH